MSKLNVLVAVKRCVDYATKVRVLPDHTVRLSILSNWLASRSRQQARRLTRRRLRKRRAWT